ncbi:MAG: hypothetical protein KJP04_07180, partial [Arenicella sp.]|nr:hypothetical protein [Arenicella sp.]
MHIELGKVVGVWGVKGWIKLHSYTRKRGDIAHYQRWFLNSEAAPGEPLEYQVVDCREQGQGIV